MFFDAEGRLLGFGNFAIWGRDYYGWAPDRRERRFFPRGNWKRAGVAVDLNAVEGTLLKVLGVERVVVGIGDVGIRLVASLDDVLAKGRLIRQGFGEQYLVPFTFWRLERAQ